MVFRWTEVLEERRTPRSISRRPNYIEDDQTAVEQHRDDQTAVEQHRDDQTAVILDSKVTPAP
jgi:hypothetical protein